MVAFADTGLPLELDRPAAEMPTTPPKEVDLRIGQNLRSGRNLRGLTQKALGESVGLTMQQIQKYENGSNRLTVSRLHQFSEVLAVPLPQFFAGLPAGGSPGGPVAQNEPLAYAPHISAEDGELLSLIQGLSSRIRRRLICLVEEMADCGEPYGELPSRRQA